MGSAASASASEPGAPSLMSSSSSYSCKMDQSHVLTSNPSNSMPEADAGVEGCDTDTPHAHSAMPMQPSRLTRQVDLWADEKRCEAESSTAHLVGAHVAVAHEVERKRRGAGRLRGRELQAAAPRGAQFDALDGQQRVGLRVTDHQPPVLVLAPRVPGGQIEIGCCND